MGVERAVQLSIGPSPIEVVAQPDEEHAAQLTREEVAASVALFETRPVELATDHPSYDYRTRLTDETRAELLTGLRL